VVKIDAVSGGDEAGRTRRLGGPHDAPEIPRILEAARDDHQRRPARTAQHLREIEPLAPGHGDDRLGRARILQPLESPVFRLVEGDPGGGEARGERTPLGVAVEARREDGRLDHQAGGQRLGDQVEPLSDEHPLAIAKIPVLPQRPEAPGEGVAPGDHRSGILRKPLASRRIIPASSVSDRRPLRGSGHFRPVLPERKVRTPEGSVLGNAQARKRDGQCNREETAGRVPRRGPPRDAPHGAAGKGETVR